MGYTAPTGSPAKQSSEQRFRASVISSTAVHVSVFLLAAFGPTFWPRAPLRPDVVPVTILRLPAPAPAAATLPEQRDPEPEPEQEPEPEPAVVAVQTEPEPIPQTLEQLRRQRDEQKRQRELDERRERERRAEEELRRRQEDADRRRREDEERRQQPQKAGRRPTATPEPERQAAQRQGITFTGAESDDQRFTVEDFPFTYYVVTIKDKVSANWSPPPRGAYAAERRVVVHFRIGRDGRVVQGPDVVASAGDTLFDQAARRAISAAAPFPPLPREYAGQSLGVHFAFVQE